MCEFKDISAIVKSYQNYLCIFIPFSKQNDKTEMIIAFLLLNKKKFNFE